MAISIRILSQQEVDKYIVNNDLNGNITALDTKVWNYRDSFIGIPPYGSGTDEQIGLFLDYVQDNTGENTTLKSYKDVYAIHTGTWCWTSPVSLLSNKKDVTINAFNRNNNVTTIRLIPSFRPVFTYIDNNYSNNLSY